MSDWSENGGHRALPPAPLARSAPSRSDRADSAPTPMLKRRTIGLAAATGAVFALIAGYLYLLQVVRGVEFRNLAIDVARREVAIPAQRGKIFERSYTLPLVTNRPAFSVDLIPGEVPAADLPRLLERLGAHLSMTPQQLAARIPKHQRHLFRPIELKRHVDFATIATLAEQIDSFPGVTWHSEPARDYGAIGALAHVTGYVGRHYPRGAAGAVSTRDTRRNSTLGKSGSGEAVRGRTARRGRNRPSYRRRSRAGLIRDLADGGSAAAGAGRGADRRLGPATCGSGGAGTARRVGGGAAAGYRSDPGHGVLSMVRSADLHR